MKSLYLICEKLFNSPMARRHAMRVLPYRFCLILITHLALFAVSFVSSVLILYEGLFTESVARALLFSLPVLVMIRLFVFWYHDLYEGLWRFVSFQDLLNIIRATIISGILFTVISVLWRTIYVSPSIIIMDFTFCIMLVGGIRFLTRNIRETFLHDPILHNAERIILVGPVGEVQPLVKEFLSDRYSRYYPLAIVDPELQPNAPMTRLSDVQVFSCNQVLSQSNRFQQIHAVVLCWPYATKKEVDALVDSLKFFQAPFKTLPKAKDILSGRVSINDIRDVEIEDLLDRKPVRIDLERIASILEHKTVLVTGGAGSIGSELCRQIAAFKPKRLVIVERSENNLYDFQRELKLSYPDLPLYASVSSINDGSGLSGLLKKFQVDIVFHAAAYKHVPLMEAAPVESAYNNVLGTFNVAQASIEAGVKRFVMISTDKAVNPTSVMGVTKHIAEMVVRSHNGGSWCRFMIVRFGNVLGSAGSVIPIFKGQIRNGGPITVTDPNIERFFMTIPEAVQLVLQAGCMGKGGEVFVLNMGTPVKIIDLAEKLIFLSGKRPNEDIEIKITGLRPGEKMYEELISEGETRLETDHSQIMVVRSEPISSGFLKSEIPGIHDLVSRRDEMGLLYKFKELVPSYQCKCLGEEKNPLTPSTSSGQRSSIRPKRSSWLRAEQTEEEKVKRHD